MITKSCWNGAASGRFSGVGRSVPYAMGVFGNQRELAGNGAEIIPKGVINLGQSLSQPAADSSLCTREPWGRGMRIAASARWASSQWQWFSVIPRSEATWGSAPFYDGRGFGPPGSSAPADAVWGVPRERHAGVVVPYGSMTGGAKRWADVGIGPYGSDVGNTQRRHDGPPGPAGATLVVPSGRGGRRGCYVSSHWRE